MLRCGDYFLYAINGLYINSNVELFYCKSISFGTINAFQCEFFEEPNWDDTIDYKVIT